MKNIIIAALIIVLAGLGWHAYQKRHAGVKTDDSAAVSPSPVGEFGDDGEEGGTVTDTSVVVTQSILGTWRSTTDTKFVRDFKIGGVLADLYDGKTRTTGTWTVFTSLSVGAPKLAVPLEPGAVYAQIVEGTQTLNFKITKITLESLVMVYLERGTTLSFSRID